MLSAVYTRVDEAREGQRQIATSELSAHRDFSVHICVFLHTRFSKDPAVQSFLPRELLRIVDYVGLGETTRPNTGVPTFPCASPSLGDLLRPTWSGAVPES